MRRPIIDSYSCMFMIISALLVVSICTMIAGIVVLMSDDSPSAISQEMHNCISNRYEGGTGIGFGIDVVSGKMKFGYGVGPVNIISF